MRSGRVVGVTTPFPEKASYPCPRCKAIIELQRENFGPPRPGIAGQIVNYHGWHCGRHVDVSAPTLKAMAEKARKEAARW